MVEMAAKGTFLARVGLIHVFAKLMIFFTTFLLIN